MPVIGVRELREKTAEVLRQLRERRAEYVITYQGRPVAILLPVDSESVEAAMVDVGRKSAQGSWETYAELIERMGRDWPPGQKTQDVLDGIRR